MPGRLARSGVHLAVSGLEPKPHPYLTERLLGAVGGELALPGSGIRVREMINSSYQVYAVGWDCEESLFV